MIETDVLVVGAGPAGSSAAKHAAMGGVEVLLIDKKSEIGAPKRCAEGVSKNGLKKLGIKPSNRWVAAEIDRVRLVSPGGIDVWLNQENVKFPETGYNLERKVFDKHMAMDAARAGSQIMVKTLARELTLKGDHVLVKAENMDKTIDIKAKIVIGADGPESRVGRGAGLKTTTKAKNMESGAQFEMVGVELEDKRATEFYFGSVAPGGYAWIFPKGDDIANVGLGVINTMTSRSAYEHLLDFVKNCKATKNAVPVEFNVGGVPVGGPLKNLVTDNVMIVGDAAGQVNPFTGGGIISGMQAGLIAGEVAANAIENGNCSHKNLEEYEKRFQEEIGNSFKKYLKAKEYFLSLSDKELDSIAKAFQGSDFEHISPSTLLNKLVNISSKAMLKLGKLF
ncbi:MAG: NAD(P)/FAD-dependent oxidoreductase [Methanobacterium sp.]